MQAVACASIRGCNLVDLQARQPPALRPAGLRLVRRVQCSAAGEVATAPSSSSQSDSVPSSWPTAACRKAAYSATSRQPAVDVPATVTGRLPEWLNGVYIRNGPGDLQAMDHMFDGYGMLSSFKLDGKSNTATGSHRFVESTAWQAYAASGKMRWREFATAPKHDGPGEWLADIASTLGGVLGLSQGVTDNASVNVVPLLDGSAVAMTETVQGTYRIDPATLRTLGQVRYDSSDGVRGDLTTAHPQLLPNGDMINFVSAVGVGFNLYRHNASNFEQRQLIATVPHRRPLAPAWVHDFPATQNYAVIPEMPLYFNVGKLLFGGSSDYIFMDWAPSDGTTLHVVDLRDGSRRTFRAPPCFVFHWANAFEAPDGRLVLDACLYEDPQIINDLYLGPLRADYVPGKHAGQAFLRRFTLDLQAPEGSQVAWQPLVADEAQASPPFDFPKVNPRYRGKPYRYVWGACSTRPTSAHNSLAKFDLETGDVQVWHEAGCLVGEPAFVPAPNSQSEDDGVVLVVLVLADGSSALVVLDGQSLTEVARCAVPYQLTIGFHGSFIPR